MRKVATETLSHGDFLLRLSAPEGHTVLALGASVGTMCVSVAKDLHKRSIHTSCADTVRGARSRKEFLSLGDCFEILRQFVESPFEQSLATDFTNWHEFSPHASNLSALRVLCGELGNSL